MFLTYKKAKEKPSPFLLQQLEEQLGGRLDKFVGEIVVGVMEFGVMLATADAEHGAMPIYQILSEILAPAERLILSV